MNQKTGRLRIAQHALLIGAALLLCGCVKFHISINVDSDGSGTIGAALGMTSQAKAFIESQDIGDPSDEIRAYLEREAFGSEVTEERWIDDDYEWVQYSAPFENPEDLNARVSATDFFESFELTEHAGLVNKTFVLDGVISTGFLESQVPNDVDIDVTQIVDMRLVVSLPGEIAETNGNKGPRESNTVWWRIKTGPPIPIQAVSEVRDAKNVRWLAVGGTLLLVLAAVAVVVVGLGVYRQRRRSS